MKNRTVRRIVDIMKSLLWPRWKVQLAFLFVLNPFGLYRFMGVCIPVLNCHGCPIAATTCPIGAFGSMTAAGIVPWLAIGMFGAVGAVLGRLPCGWACPFGFLQDLISKIPVPRWEPPRWTRFIKYGVLAGTVFVAAAVVGTGTRWYFCGICPAGTLQGGFWYRISEGVPIPTVRLLFLAGFLLLMLFVHRGFCRIACPIGAGLALFNRISLLSIKLLPRWCSKCMKCRRACPAAVGPFQDQRTAECVYCLECFKCMSLKLDLSSEKDL